MARCPYLETVDTGWFSCDLVCELTGAKVGDLNNKTKVKNLCDKDGSSEYETCPVYRSR